MRFQYLRDPLFLVCLFTYFVNRWLLKSIWPTGFVHDHLNDLLCIPFWVPIMLWAQRRVGLRGHDDPPRPNELLIPLVLWSWIFEVILPRTGLLGERCVPDPVDIVFYCLGALLAGVFWRWRYSKAQASEPPAPAGEVKRQALHSPLTREARKT